MSNRGYGMFMHTSAPVTCDFGATNINVNKLFMGDETMDFFVFFGEPKDILNEYTEIVGKPGMPPLWSFGTWMSRITYFSQKDGYLSLIHIYPCLQLPGSGEKLRTCAHADGWRDVCKYTFQAAPGYGR